MEPRWLWQKTFSSGGGRARKLRVPEEVSTFRACFCGAGLNGTRKDVGTYLLVKAIMRELLFVLAFPFIVSTVRAGTVSAGVSASAVIREMNLARTDPGAYAAHIEAMRAKFSRQRSCSSGTDDGADKRRRSRARRCDPLSESHLAARAHWRSHLACAEPPPIIAWSKRTAAWVTVMLADRMNRYGRWGAMLG